MPDCKNCKEKLLSQPELENTSEARQNSVKVLENENCVTLNDEDANYSEAAIQWYIHNNVSRD
ncbi:hypothetical protein EBZ39_09555 [bacterium]|nr:hypothetical protein [bacterium]